LEIENIGYVDIYKKRYNDDVHELYGALYFAINRDMFRCHSESSEIGHCFYSSFPIENGLKQGDALSPLLLNFAL